jgi:hypothetical protein
MIPFAVCLDFILVATGKIKVHILICLSVQFQNFRNRKPDLLHKQINRPKKNLANKSPAEPLYYRRFNIAVR